MPTTYIVQTMDAGWENPFRPGGELSKEADQIVRAIQSGRPLDSSLEDEPDTPAQLNGGVHAETPSAAQNGVQEPLLQPVTHISVTASAPSQQSKQDGAVSNGAGAPDGATNSSGAPAAPQTVMVASIPGTVEVQHSLVRPEDASQVEQVTLKKKPRGKCCVLQ